MSAIKYAIDHVLNISDISIQALELTFMRKSSIYHVNTTLEKQIQDLVITPIVLRDTNLLGGVTITIPVDQCFVTLYQLNPTVQNYVIQVPYELTGNRKIISPLSLVMQVEGVNEFYNANGGNGLMNAVSNSFNHTAGEMPGIVYTNLELIANNTILVNDNVATGMLNAYLRIMIESNDNLSNLQPTSYLTFAELVVLAVKAYIYKTLRVELDKGALYYGHELSSVTDEVNSYADKYEEYKTFLREKWQKIMFMNDSRSKTNFIKGMINPNI